jgi:hypothetical protein
LEKTAQNRPIVQNSAEPVMAAIIKCVNISIPEKYYESSLTESSPTNPTRAGSGKNTHQAWDIYRSTKYEET